MPLIVLTGTPWSGKSKRASELKDHFIGKGQKAVIVTDELKLSQHGPNAIYSNAALEKELRSSLKSEVQRSLCSPDTIVILDAANYIKGCRYELFCVVKEVRTNHMVIQCEDAPEDILEARFDAQASSNNTNNQEDNGQINDKTKLTSLRDYSRDMFIELVRRYEKPNPNNRWDSPLFSVAYNSVLPFADIDASIFNRANYTPNLSTVMKPVSSDNFIGLVDTESQEIIKQISTCLSLNQLQGIKIPNCDVQVNLNRKLSLIELNKLRRQFLNYCKMNPFKERERIRPAFVQFINKSLII